jgi:nucleoside-diphosphate-sugar epimerase
MSAPDRTAVVAGASGITGRGLLETLTARGWDVVALSRSKVDRPGVRSISVDLMDSAASRSALSGLGEVTHIFYAGRYAHKASVAEPVVENLMMLRNTVEPIEAASPKLRHVHLVHGTKYYGSNTGPFSTPAREDDPRSLAPNFYYAQQDYLAARQVGKAWTWSASRPHGLLHSIPDAPRNLVLIVAVYALICRELKLPLSFPGTPENYRALYQCTSVDHLGEAIVWMAGEPACANDAFNITNGDVIRWARLWPVFAKHFQMEVGPVRTLRLASVMADKGEVWAAICSRYGLRSPPYEKLVLWDYGDFVFTPHWDIMSDTTKIRQCGFASARRTQEEFLRYFDEFRARGVLPPA